MGFAASKVVPTKVTIYERNNGKWVTSDTTEYTYNSKGYEKKAVRNYRFYYGDGTYDAYKTTTKKSYDSKGRIKTMYVIEKGEGTSKYVYTYISKNRIKRIDNYYKKKGASKYSSDGHTTYYYSSKKNQIKTYDENNKLIEKTVDTLNSKGKVKTSKHYYYGELLSTTKYYYSNGVLNKTIETGIGKTTCYYNKKGNVTKEVYEDGFDTNTKKYSYDKYGRLTKITEKGVMESDDDDDAYSYKTSYVYKGYFSKRIYPKKVFVYFNDGTKAFEKTITTYKKVG